jgi:glycine/D-amino acid oxidase-like deaminating enzyme
VSNDKSYTIIGWGLAGATLAWQFYLNKIKFQIFDSGENHSTRTAAGLVNPIVFKRLTKSWKADQLLPYAKRFYERIENELDVSLMSHRSILRIFASVEEQNNWASLEGDDRFSQYLLPIQDVVINKIDAPHGGGKVKTIGNLDTNLFLDASKSFFLSKGVEIVNGPFDYYSVNDFEEFIFCEGFEIRNNFFFNYLPMKPTHGETLTIKSEEISFEEIVNKNMFVLPLGNGEYKIGATYNWKLTESEVTPFGKKELLEKLSAFASFNFEVVDHKAGIRPTVSDRRPLIGTHPENSNLHVFNGLGTKGVMIAPYFSEQMFNYLVNGEALDSEVDIKRHAKHFNA